MSPTHLPRLVPSSRQAPCPPGAERMGDRTSAQPAATREGAWSTSRPRRGCTACRLGRCCPGHLLASDPHLMGPSLTEARCALDGSRHLVAACSRCRARPTALLLAASLRGAGWPRLLQHGASAGTPSGTPGGTPACALRTPGQFVAGSALLRSSHPAAPSTHQTGGVGAGTWTSKRRRAVIAGRRSLRTLPSGADALSPSDTRRTSGRS